MKVAKKYDVYKTKKKIVSENKLTASPREDIFYDFSIFDDIKELDAEIIDAIKKELMKYHAVGAGWINQPIPFLVSQDPFTNYYCNLETAFTKVFKSNGNRMMIIVNVAAAKINKWERQSIYDRNYSHVKEYRYLSDYTDGQYPDIEIA